ncbi:MAG: MBL fold metallo-hydrolase [Proteobacteria bacterium]|nr:MAG: MBL fold metallo-hydrolase [Pseudomonadota bacterium]
MKIGPYRIHAIPTGLFGLDGGAMFGTVPKVLWEKTNPADAQNRIEMEARALLLDGGPGQRILIDCGIGGDFIAKYGEKLGTKFGEMYSVSEETSVATSLAKLGLKTSDINHVILTHLHFDHTGGATKAIDGKLVPTFESAKYYVQRANYETAVKPNIREKASYYLPNFEPLNEAGVLTFLDGPTENLLPGVSVLISDGHTHGQQVVKITDGTETLLYCGDLIPTSTHVRLAWVMGYDLEPLTLIEEKRKLLAEAAKGNWTLFFEHDPYADAAKVEEAKGDYAVRERLALA